MKCFIYEKKRNERPTNTVRASLKLNKPNIPVLVATFPLVGITKEEYVLVL